MYEGIQHTSMRIDGSIPRDGPGSAFSWTTCDPHSGMDRRPKREDTVNVAVVKEENGVKS